MLTFVNVLLYVAIYFFLFCILNYAVNNNFCLQILTNVPRGLTIAMMKLIVQTPMDHSHVLVTLVGLATEKLALVGEK